MFSDVQLFRTPRIAHHSPLSWNFPGKNTGVDSNSLLQGEFPDPGKELMSLVSLPLTGRFFTS